MIAEHGDLGYNIFMPFTKGHPPYKGIEKGWFPKDHEPWSKSQKGVTLNTGRTHFKKNEHSSLATEFKKSDVRLIGENNSNWRGDKVGYFALHSWVTRQLGKASKCEHCKTVNLKYEWANKSHEYKRDLTDWISLCFSCHRKYDNWAYKVWESRRRNSA